MVGGDESFKGKARDKGEGGGGESVGRQSETGETEEDGHGWGEGAQRPIAPATGGARCARGGDRRHKQRESNDGTRGKKPPRRGATAPRMRALGWRQGGGAGRGYDGERERE